MASPGNSERVVLGESGRFGRHIHGVAYAHLRRFRHSANMRNEAEQMISFVNRLTELIDGKVLAERPQNDMKLITES